MVAPERRGHGYTVRQLNCVFPELPPMVGYARTATVRAKEPGPSSAEDYLELRFAYFDYLASGAAPRVSVVQDLDDGQPGYGAFWGEVNSNVHKALGCLGTVTNGSVRDLEVIAEDFQLLAGVIAPSLVHADRHGAVVIPHAVARAVPGALDLMQRREALIIAAAREPGATPERLKEAYRRSGRIES